MEWNKTDKSVDTVYSDIPIGKLCCFIPLDETNKNAIYFGHLAGIVVDNFETMSFTYVLTCDNRYFFSRKVIITPDDVHTSHEARRYFE